MTIEIVSFDEVCARRPSTQRADGHHAITPELADQLITLFNTRRPEAGAKLFGPRDSGGADTVEFDALGSACASGVAYAPDTEWGAARVAFHLAEEGERQRVWDGDVHLHPDGHFTPSSIKGLGIGDEGYGLAALTANLWLQDYFMPILTRSNGRLRLAPWLVSRDHPGEARYVELRIGPVADFPTRRYNATFESKYTTKSTVNSAASRPTNSVSMDTGEEVKPPVAGPPLPTLVLDLDEVARRAGARLAVEAKSFVFQRAHCAVHLSLNPDFPRSPPLVVLRDGSDRELSVPFRWREHHDLRPEIRLAKLIRGQIFSAWLVRGLRPLERYITRSF